MAIKQKTFIELCSGAGGMSLGFIANEFDALLLNDIDKTCCKTLSLNHNDLNIIEGSFTDIDFTEYKNVDVMVGGVPCQAFSQSGKREGFKDKRGNLLLEFIKKISLINPKIFVIENVKGLTNHDKGNTFKIILKKLENLKKYNIYYKVLNANDYGVPQKRERLFIVGVDKNIKKKYTFPKENTYKPVLKDVLINVPKSEGYKYNKEKCDVMKLVPQGGCWVDLPDEIQRKYMKQSYFSSGGRRGIARRLSMNEPSLTLLTSPSQKQTERCHPLELRPLSIREYARIQTFPDDYVFCGSIASQYKQIGNAVPVKLAEKIAESIKILLI